jgi:hypothetical protein
MKTARDMTQKQFNDACRKLGFIEHGMMGYYKLPDAPNVSVSIWNAVPITRRGQLAYLIRENESHRKEAEEFQRQRAALGLEPKESEASR